MSYPSLKKAASIALASLAATPQVLTTASKGGRNFNPANVYVHDGVNENPAEKLAGERDAAVRELQDLLDRAMVLFQLSQRAPYYANFSAKPSIEELAEIKRCERAVAQYSAALRVAAGKLNEATNRLNARLRGMQPGTKED